MFNCWGIKNQVNTINVNSIESTKKYLLTFLFLHCIRKQARILVGTAHKRLKLFFVMLWSVIVHMKTNNIPSIPEEKKIILSIIEVTNSAKLFLNKLMIRWKNIMEQKTSIGVSIAELVFCNGSFIMVDFDSTSG